MLPVGRADGCENTNHALPPGARSPHPYRRQSLDIPDRLFVTNLAARDRQPPTASRNSPHPRLRATDSDLTDYFSRERELPRAFTTSPSDSGTEADDEKPYLKGLPPAPGKRHKGLKGNPEPATPSDLDGLNDDLLSAGHTSHQANAKVAWNLTTSTLEAKTARYAAKWRAELLRRFLEVSFVCGLASLSLNSAQGDLKDKHRGRAEINALSQAKSYVVLHFAIHLCRLVWQLQQHIRHSWKRCRAVPQLTPPPTDPAPFLYPALLPATIAALATPSWASFAFVLQVNVGLGCMSLWLFSAGKHGDFVGILLPVIVLLAAPSAIRLDLVKHYDPTKAIDELNLLGPLLGSFAPTIQYFCGNSLLQAETGLLAIGLLNIYSFAAAPQAVILKSLMWIGSMTLVILCRHVMKWSTALARIPSWRFRSPRHANAPAPGDSGLSALQTILKASSFLPSPSQQESSDEREWLVDDPTPKLVRAGLKLASRPPAGDRASGTIELDAKKRPNAGKGASGSVARRHTISAAGLSSSLSSHMTPSNRRQRSHRSKPFLRLTRTQALLLKWLYAIYCYVAVVGIIFLPVRSYIQAQALAAKEPVGWALAYLFGDLTTFRFHVVVNDLDSWISLPPRYGDPQNMVRFSLDCYRHYFAGAANSRLVIIAWCLLNLALGITAVIHLRTLVEVDTRRKVFHGMMVSMFLPSIFIDPCFAALALSLMLAIFLLLDLFRAAQLPPISKPLTNFLAPYVDGRDHKGPIVISPIFLLIGCAIPLWLSLASQDRGSDIINDPEHPWHSWEVPRRDLGMVAGVICVGMGDAAASLIGRRYGKRRWIWSGGKSLEGSAAFVLAVTAGLLAAESWRRICGWDNLYSNFGASGPFSGGDDFTTFTSKALLAGAGASFTEAVLTGGNDNVIVPVVLWILVRLLKI